MNGGALRYGETLDDLIIGGLKIIQPREGYRFSIDAVLLAHFADLLGVNKVVDLGTGNGIIPLLLSQRDPGIRILGIDIQPAMVDRAGRSVRMNNLQNRIDIQHADIRRLQEILPGEIAELVLSNPPFWERGKGHVNRNQEEAIARHELQLTLEELVAGATHLLVPEGAVALIHRAARLADIADTVNRQGLSLSKMRMVHSYADRPANLVLVEARPGHKWKTEVMPPLIIYSAFNSFSDEIRRFYRET